ncbi:Hypothetical protein EPM1_0294 [Stenotrophomonas maltophilia EPM1]|nr:Hypothetical protein EPM1_0294 [Stenotrophomonas maltophilia EPM1]
MGESPHRQTPRPTVRGSASGQDVRSGGFATPHTPLLRGWPRWRCCPGRSIGRRRPVLHRATVRCAADGRDLQSRIAENRHPAWDGGARRTTLQTTWRPSAGTGRGIGKRRVGRAGAQRRTGPARTESPRLGCERDRAAVAGWKQRAGGVVESGSRQGIEVRSHQSGNAADPRILHQRIRRGRTAVKRVTQGFNCDIKSYEIAELEAIDDGFGYIADVYETFAYATLFQPRVEGLCRHADHSEGRPIDPRNAVAVADGDPAFEWRLGGQAMQAQGTQQAQTGVRQAFGNDPQSIIGVVTVSFRQRVDATRQPDQRTGLDQSGQLGAGDPGGHQLAGAQGACASQQLSCVGLGVSHDGIVP